MDTFALQTLIDKIQVVLGAMCILRSTNPTETQFDFNARMVMNGLEELGKVCDDLDLSMSRIAVERTIGDISSTIGIREGLPHENFNVYRDAIPRQVNDVIRTIREEASLRTYFYLPEKRRELYADPNPFGATVWRVFPNAISDIEEAAKCLALHRPTASVFHSMRAVDHGIKGLIEASFGDTSFLAKRERRIWSEIVRRIRQESNKSDAAICEQWKGRQARLNALAEHLSLVAEASRNPTMHAESTYTVEQAQDVFNTTKAFMRRLVDEMDQDGKHGTEEPENTENASGRGNPGTQAERRDAGLDHSAGELGVKRRY